MDRSQQHLFFYRFSREGDVLGSASSGQELSAMLQLAHQLAEAWIGFEVTPETWSDMWLREGISGLLEAWLVDMVGSSVLWLGKSTTTSR
jgi:hypothetical protein